MVRASEPPVVSPAAFRQGKDYPYNGAACSQGLGVG